GLLAAAGAFRQAGEIFGGHLEVGGWVVRLDERLANVVNRIVALLRRQERPGWHLAEPLAECFVNAERITAVLERLLPERTRSGQRAGLRKISVAGDTDAVVEFF